MNSKRNMISLEKGKIPPQAVDLEEAVLGALMIDAKAIVDVEFLYDYMFYKEAHRLIYKAIIDLYIGGGTNIDLITIANKLRKENNLDAVGGDFYLVGLTQKVSSSAHIEFHGRIIVQMYIKRELISSCSKTIEKSYDQDSDVFDLLDTAYNRLNEVSEASIKKQEIPFSEVVSDVLERGVKIYKKEIKAGIDTPIKNLTAKTGGLRDSEVKLLAGRPGSGKGLLIDEIIKTPEGNKMIGDLKIGDEICGTDGGCYNVIGIYPQGIRPIYEIEFDDGLKIKADDQHLWEVQDRKIRKKGSNDTRVLTTKQLIKEGLYVNNTNRKNFTIKYPEPIYHSKKQITTPPYILGLFIGDGYLSEKKIGFTNSENDIIEKVRSYVGEKLVQTGKRSFEYRVNKCHLHQEFKELGLIGKLSYDKFIPDNYLYTCINERLELLRGLLDSDGHVLKNHGSYIEYSTSSEKLKTNIMTLVRGLGGRCSFTQRMGCYKKNNKRIKTRVNYRIWISFQKSVIPVSSKKHLLVYYNNKRFHKRFIKNIEYYGEKETICIKVNSPDECFLMNDYVVTHNTAFALAYALHASKQGIPTAFFSLEMSNEQLVSRILSMEYRIDGNKFNMHGLNAQDEMIIRNGQLKLNKLPLYIDDTASLSIELFQVKAKRLVSKFGVKFIIIDYLQLMSGGNPKNREQEISKISRGIKLTAKELNIPIIALSQLSRAVETRGGSKRPMLSDLRDSGTLEQDADIVEFIYRPEYYGLTEWSDNREPCDGGYDREPCEGEAEYIVAKNRNGGLVRDRMKFEARYTLFSDIDPDEFIEGEFEEKPDDEPF